MTEVDQELFTAELWPIGDAERGAVVLADFNVADIAASDRELLVVGATFYCSVRSVIGRGGQPHRTSSVRLRRLGLWSEDSLSSISEKARQEARRFAEFVD